MPINSGQINGLAINGGPSAVTTYQISADIAQTVTAIHTITATIAQDVFVIHTPTFNLSQTVTIREVYAVSATVGQTVTTTHAVSATISQGVIIPSTAEAVQWQAIVYLDGSQVANLVGDVIVEMSEGDSRLASFSAVPASGALDLTTWLGADVTIDYLDDKGNYRRRFTGVVDEPVYDLTTNIATFNCVAVRRDLLNAKSKDEINLAIAGSYWSGEIFDPEADNAQYAEDRLSTVSSTYDHDAQNNFRLVPFAAKGIADYSYDETSILNESLSFQLASRDQLLNEVTINFDYRYPRLRHRERAYTWDFVGGAPSGYDIHSVWAAFLQTPTSLCPRAAIETAINQTSWLLKAPPTYTGLPAAGFYGGIGWTPKQTAIEYERDADGNLILDASGQPVRKSRRVSDATNVYAIDASWTLAKRFAQTLTEAYAVTISATQSVAQYGSLKREESRGIAANYDTRQWEDHTVYTAPTGTLSANGDYVIDQDTNRATFDNAWNTAEAVARREILQTHRSNYVDFAVLLDPRLDLRHTVAVSTTPLTARGKVARIIERMSIEEGSAVSEIRLAVSKSTGAAPSDPGIAPPTAPTATDPTFVPPTKALYNHFGNHYSSPALDGSENGFICNYRTTDFISSQVQVYPTMFVVDAEQIESPARDEWELLATQTKEIEIPDEVLTVTAP